MAIDWNKEWRLTWKIWKWWFRTGLLAIPFGIIYAETRLRLGHESKLAVVICVSGALICNYILQGPPPNE